mmetsp:Transcript_15589/g.35775  ORF Transcript_15589/g.35775 Transcript_15589/m.35775 type:complete len:265 (+) Transcript_15589:61-855(+)
MVVRRTGPGSVQAASVTQTLKKRPAASVARSAASLPTGVGRKEDFAAAARRIETSLRFVARPAKAPQMAMYLKNLFVLLGVSSPDRRAAVAEDLKAWSARTTPEVVGICNALYDMPHRECHYVACDILLAHKPTDVDMKLRLVKSLICKHSWWDTVDALSSCVGQVLDCPGVWPEVDAWITDPNMWLRRSAIICQRTRGQKTDAKRMFRYCKLCAREKEFFIEKAIGWALRSYARVDAQAVRDFVAATPLRPLSAREGLKHLRP